MFVKATKHHALPAPVRSKTARMAAAGPDRRNELARLYARRYFRKNEPTRSMPAP